MFSLLISVCCCCYGCHINNLNFSNIFCYSSNFQRVAYESCGGEKVKVRKNIWNAERKIGLGVDWRILLKLSQRNRMERCGLDSCGSGYRPVAYRCKHDNEPLVEYNDGNSLNSSGRRALVSSVSPNFQTQLYLTVTVCDEAVRRSVSCCNLDLVNKVLRLCPKSTHTTDCQGIFHVIILNYLKRN
jgi:hypothetical protein